jgi:hypothetical protein
VWNFWDTGTQIKLNCFRWNVSWTRESMDRNRCYDDDTTSVW